MTEILFSALSYAIVGAAMEVHRVLGPGFLEAVYQAALQHELTLRGIPFEAQKRLAVVYKGQIIGEYIADLVIDGKIIPSTKLRTSLELKAISKLTPAHEAQAHHYLAATGLHLAILLNPSTGLRASFGAPSLEQKRIARGQEE